MKLNIIEIFVLVLVAVAVVVAGVNSVISMGNFQSKTDSFIRPHVKVINLTLSERENWQSLVSVTNCTSKTLAASNYTDYISVGKLQINDNSTTAWKGSSVCVAYLYGFRLTGVYGVIAALIALFLVVFAVIKIYEKTSVSGR